jgi:uncharacterized protein
VKALLILLALARVAVAEPTSTRPLDDEASVIAELDEVVIEGELRRLSGTGVDLAVIVTPSLGGVAIESYAHAAAVQWTSGRAETASAAVLVIAIMDRKSRIEVNDAFRLKFPDSRAQVTLDNIRGFLRSSDYAGAVRAVITDVGKAERGEPPDLESPNPPSNLPATTTTPSAPIPDSDYPRYGTKSDNTVLILVIGGIAFVLGMGALWAWTARKGNFTLSHDGSVKTLERPFVVDWLWHSAKLVGWLGFIVFLIASASSSSSSNTSSSWGSSSSGGGSSGGFSGGGGSSSGGGGGGGGGGWSGGGASSSW